MQDRFSELGRRMKTTHVMVTIHVGKDEVRQRALVDTTMQVRGLIEAARRKHIEEASENDEYALFDSKNQRVSPNTHVGDLNGQDELWLRPMPKNSARIADVLSLYHEASGQSFAIARLPVVIGRLEKNDTRTAVIDLGKLEQGRSVSRQHVEIRQQDGLYRIRNMSEHNTLTVNQSSVAFDQNVELRDNAQISVGHITLVFHCKPRH